MIDCPTLPLKERLRQRRLRMQGCPTARHGIGSSVCARAARPIHGWFGMRSVRRVVESGRQAAREPPAAVGGRKPWLSRAAPNLKGGRQPRGVIERSRLDDREFRLLGQQRDDGRTAVRAELALTFLAGIGAHAHIRGERVAPDMERCARDDDEDREGRACLALAVFAVADDRHQGLAVAAVGQASAQATPVELSGHIDRSIIAAPLARIWIAASPPPRRSGSGTEGAVLTPTP